MKQITIVVNDPRRPVIADISTRLAEAGINIDSLDAEGFEQVGVINLTVDRYDAALQLLREAGYSAIAEDAMVVRLDDKPGALAKLAVKFKDAAIDIRSMRIVKREDGSCLVAIVAEKTPEALAIIQDQLVSEAW